LSCVAINGALVSSFKVGLGDHRAKRVEGDSQSEHCQRLVAHNSMRLLLHRQTVKHFEVRFASHVYQGRSDGVGVYRYIYPQISLP